MSANLRARVTPPWSGETTTHSSSVNIRIIFEMFSRIGTPISGQLEYQRILEFVGISLTQSYELRQLFLLSLQLI